MKAANEDPVAFPRLTEVEQNLRPGGVFKGVTLFCDGWLQAIAEKILEKNASIGLREKTMRSKTTINDLQKIEWNR